MLLYYYEKTTIELTPDTKQKCSVKLWTN